MLGKAVETVAVQTAEPGSVITAELIRRVRAETEAAIQTMIAFLDRLDGNPDDEPLSVMPSSLARSSASRLNSELYRLYRFGSVI